MSGIQLMFVGGGAAKTVINLSITTDTTNYDVYANRGPTYVAGSSEITVTIGPAATVYSTSTGTAAFTIPSAFSPGDTITVVNNGVILGRGGNGGAGANKPASGAPGSPGGGAFSTARAVTVNNLNRIAGGGGGGGGGGGMFFVDEQGTVVRGGGGGGGGIGNGSGGSGAPSSGAGPVVQPGPGTSGTLIAAGSGGPGDQSSNLGGSANGGPGGTYGSSGSNGQDFGGASPSGGGGNGGYAISGNPFITYINTGTRNGGIS
jgi:hypothetical protein